MVLYIIGLGLGDEEDVTVKGRAAIARCGRVWLEAYTSLLPGVSAAALAAAFGKPVELAHRETVESDAEAILAPARGAADAPDGEGHVAFLVVGDPFGATTHTDLFLRARRAGVEVVVVHNASIMNAVGACGLQLYAFGQTLSIPFFRPGWRPDSWYDRLAHNAAAGLHTLLLLDIKAREPDFEALVRTGRLSHEPPRFMTVNQCVAQLLEVEAARGGGLCGPTARAVCLARVGVTRGAAAQRQRIVSGTLAELAAIDFGPPLHSLVLVGAGAHALEIEMLDFFAAKGDEPRYVAPREAAEGDKGEEGEKGESGGGSGGGEGVVR
jgi:diphthine synthase